MKKKLIIIAGLCSIENEKMTYKVAKYLKKATSKYPYINFIFKASFDKANRTSGDSYRGVGEYEGTRIFKMIKQKLGIKILTDVHTPAQAYRMANIVDILQIPAFLCRQTDLVNAVAKTGKTINIKKGQFLAPEDIKHVIDKIEWQGNCNIMLTERGTCFGYRNLVVDYRSFLIMQRYEYPVIFDATHSQQRPSEGMETGGSREFTVPMILGAIATGVDGIFIEVHPNPPDAKSDRATVLNLKEVPKILKKIDKIYKARC